METTAPYTNNITTTPVPVSQIDHTGYVFVPLFLVVGIVGNSLTIMVMLTKSFRSMPVSKSLIALSLSDICVNLLFPFNKPFVKALLGTDIRALSSGGCKLYFWAYRFFKTTSSWMVVAISCERFVAVWIPLKAKSFNTTKNTYITIGCIYVFLAVYIGYWCSWADQIIGGKCIPNTRPLGMEVQSQVFLVIGLLLYAYIPAVTVLVLNGMIVYKLMVIKKNKERISPQTNSLDVPQGNKPSAKSKSHSKTTVMLICVAIAFVVLVTPNSTSHVVSFAKKQNIFETTDKGIVFFREISQVMEQLNNSINFFLYVLCSKRFRDRVLAMFNCNGSSSVGPEGSTANATNRVVTIEKQDKSGNNGE